MSIDSIPEAPERKRPRISVPITTARDFSDRASFAGSQGPAAVASGCLEPLVARPCGKSMVHRSLDHQIAVSASSSTSFPNSKPSTSGHSESKSTRALAVLAALLNHEATSSTSSLSLSSGAALARSVPHDPPASQLHWLVACGMLTMPVHSFPLLLVG